MSDADARDVIARAIIDEMRRYNLTLGWGVGQHRADAIIAALADAGYALVRKGEQDDRYEQGYTDGGNSKLADVILFFDEVFEVEPMGHDLNARIVKELEERF